MKCLPTLLILLSFLWMSGCTTKTVAPEPSYSGKIEVLKDGKVLARRDYRYKLHELSVCPRHLSSAINVKRGKTIATLLMYERFHRRH